MNIKDRILQIIEYYNFSIRSFEKKIGTSNGQISKCIARNSAIKSDILAKILEICPDIDANWLITGNGEMLKRTPATELQSDATAALWKDVVPREMYDTVLAQKDTLIKQLDDRIVSQAHFLEAVSKSYMVNSEHQNTTLKEIYHLLVEEREMIAAIQDEKALPEHTAPETLELPAVK